MSRRLIGRQVSRYTFVCVCTYACVHTMQKCPLSEGFPTQSMSAPAFSTGTKMRSTNSWFSVFSQSFMQCHLPQRAMFHRWPNRWQMVVSDWDYASDLEYFWEVLTPSSPSRNQETGRRGIQCFHWHSKYFTSSPTTAGSSHPSHMVFARLSVLKSSKVGRWSWLSLGTRSEVKGQSFCLLQWPCYPMAIHGNPNCTMAQGLKMRRNGSWTNNAWHKLNHCIFNHHACVLRRIIATSPQEAKLITYLSINQLISSLPKETFGPLFALSPRSGVAFLSLLTNLDNSSTHGFPISSWFRLHWLFPAWFCLARCSTLSIKRADSLDDRNSPPDWKPCS